MTEKRLIRYKVLADDYDEIRRILFIIEETGEEIEGSHHIEKWVNDIFKENKRLNEENEQLKKDLLELHEICEYYEGRIKELQE